MKQEELEKKVIELEEKIDAVTEHSDELEEQTRQAFSKILKLMTRYASANNEIAERTVSNLEEELKSFDEDDENA